MGLYVKPDEICREIIGIAPNLIHTITGHGSESKDGKKRIGVDFDDTIADLKRPTLEVVRKQFDIDISFEAITKFKLEENTEGLTEVDVKKIFRALWRDYEKIEIVDPNIPKILQELSRTYSIAITTATDADRSTLLKWLQMHNIPFDEIIHVRSSMDKLKYGSVDAYIDDNHGVIEGASMLGRPGLVLEQPWNSEYRAGMETREALETAINSGSREIAPVSSTTWSLDEIAEKLSRLFARIRPN